MKIAEYIKTSFVDYEPYISAVVFTKGCNMKCLYCHNKDLIFSNKYIPKEEVINHLKRRRKQIDAVVITGGEPTLHDDLIDFIKEIKDMGFLVKLDTNGTNPIMLKKLINENLLDYIAMDLKAPPKYYRKICGLDYKSVKESFNIIKEFGNYEFRTTVYPLLSLENILEISDLVDKNNYYIQQYRKNTENDIEPYDDNKLINLSKKLNIKLRGVFSI